jgi:heme-degrading monooxygenase HmoA
MEAMTRREFMQASVTSAAAVAAKPLGTIERNGTADLPFAVVFEVQTTAKTHETYLDTARKLRPMLDTIPGFLSIERSSSLVEEHKLLSLSYWGDEAALVQWRSTGEHHAAQQAGRDGIFADYRLRVGPVIFDDLKNNESPSEPVSRYNRPPFHNRRFMPLMQINGISDAKQFEGWFKRLLTANSQPDLQGYRSLSNPGRYYLSLSSADWADALGASGRLVRTCTEHQGSSESTLQIIEVERDYGMEVREQAPQFFRSISSNNKGGPV